MKRIAFLSIILMEILAIPPTFGGNKGKMARPYIHYQVNIQNYLPSGQTICPSSVMITDQNGYPIGTIQPYHPYIMSYHFYELGPVNGIRVAHLSVDPFGDVICPVTPIPVPRTGPFLNGTTYMYSMVYGIRPPSPIPLPPASE